MCGGGVVGWVLWHSNKYRLFNAESFFYILYIISKRIFVYKIFKQARIRYKQLYIDL